MKSDFINRYITAKTDLSISILGPGGSFYTFDYLKAGQKYPLRVKDILNFGGQEYMQFQTGNPEIYPGSNLTYIPFVENQLVPEQQSYVTPPVKPGIAESISKELKTFLLIGGAIYVIGQFAGRK